MFGDFDIRGQGAGAESPQIYMGDAVLARTERRSHARSRVQFDLMALPIIEGQRIAFVAVAPG